MVAIATAALLAEPLVRSEAHSAETGEDLAAEIALLCTFYRHMTDRTIGLMLVASHAGSGGGDMRASDSRDPVADIRDPEPVVNEGLSPSGSPAQAGVRPEDKVDSETHKVNSRTRRTTLKHVFLLPWHWSIDYPRASVSAILTVVASVAGVLLLPSHRVMPDINQPAISVVSLKTTPRVPAYLGFIVRSARVGEIMLGFDIPKGVTVHWKVFLSVNTHRDHLAWRNYRSKKFKPFPAGNNPYLYGQLTGPAERYQQLKQGYWSFWNNLGVFSLTMQGQLIPKLSTVFVRTSGTDKFIDSSGYDVAATLPTLLETPPSASEKFISEDVAHVAGFQNITGGPMIENGTWWAWREAGVLPGPSATGMDDVAHQKFDNRSFDSAVAFGVAGASFAAFLVEGVGAVSESRKRRSDSIGPARSHPS